MWRAAAAAMMVMLGGCPSGPGGVGPAARRHTREPSAADLKGIERTEIRVEPSSAGVTTYGTEIQHPLSEVEAAVVQAMAGEPMRHRPALSRMVRELATAMPERLNAPPSLVDGLMSWSGLVDPHPRLVLVEMSEDPHQCHQKVSSQCAEVIGSLVEQLKMSRRDGESENLVFGVGVVKLPDGKRTRMMGAVLDPAVALEPMPRSVGAAAPFTVAGILLGPRTAPHVEVVAPGGHWERLPTSLSVDGRFSAQVNCSDGAGRYQVEVLANGTHGIEVAANFPVYCGAQPPSSIPVLVERIEDSVGPGQLARANFLFLNEERRRRGLPDLAWDPEAAAVALGHSQDMHDNGFVGHVSPRSGDVIARFERAGLRGPIVRENVARGYGPLGIHNSLMASPGHRANILAPDVTHVGIASVIAPPDEANPDSPRSVFLTQNFYKKPGAGVPRDNLGPLLQDKVDARRVQLGIAAVRWDDALSKIATKRAEALAKGRAAPEYDKDVFALGYQSVDVHLVSSIDFDALAGLELWAEPQLELGLGVARGKEGGGETFVLVVMVGERGE